jgi:intergrase/recombinase
MGSAANVMGYHVAAHLALHKWFIEQSRPVPGFLILDQPSQVFFPDDVRRAEDEAITDEDRERITALYALILRVIGSLGERLQVVVLDHANLDEDWFQERVVENWRNGRALVPEGWIRSGD